ncbi:NUDIX domain-containing protein [Deinococcus sp. Arct2-2]|uniref:NUDIX domain-containing protein n=1 Tax=Deinococcus sp. Arct2-2 TaxID=2568653 RepID=UPI0010A2F43D|nr:NUDIX domain-containing protein [Deinococcus sp. Arct2-2]THF71332.1 NUDIX domain-containing protein [Deinococcus sp. Arct2-2]
MAGVLDGAALVSVLAPNGRQPVQTQRVGAGVAVLDGKNVLLIRRPDNGLWDIPGGAVESGEVEEDAARRELREETALGAGTLTLRGVFSGSEFQHTYPDGNVVEWVTVLFSAHWNGEPPRAGDDAAAVAWGPLDALPADLSLATQRYLVAIQTGAAYA